MEVIDDKVLAELSAPFEGYEIEWMPKRIDTGNRTDTVYCQLIGYKDARTDMLLLDNIVGPSCWQNEYKRDSKGVLQCGIGIYCHGKEWVWKWSNGMPSNFEKEKGEYSDAFKRAGTMWGIGRCLYELAPAEVILNESEYYVDQNNKIKPTKRFNPNLWDWFINWGDDPEAPGMRVKAVQTNKDGSKVTRYDSNPYGAKNPRPKQSRF